MTTKQTETREINAIKIHVKLSHPGEDRMLATAKNLYYTVKEKLEVFEDWDTSKTNNESLHEVAEEHNLNMGKTIYLDLIP